MNNVAARGKNEKNAAEAASGRAAPPQNQNINNMNNRRGAKVVSYVMIQAQLGTGSRGELRSWPPWEK